MNLEDQTLRWNPHIQEDEKQDILQTEWTEVPNEYINNNHSSESLKWDEENYFSKEKDRAPAKTIQELTRTGEIDHRLLLYEEHHNTNVHAPTPYCAALSGNEEDGDQVIMDFMGDQWASFPKAFSQGDLVDEQNVRQVTQGLGQFAKILENEQMRHGDIALRHFYVDQETYDVGVIDIEGGSVSAKESAIAEERQQIEDVIERIPRPQYEDQLEGWFEEGYDQVPEPEDTNIPTSVYETEDNGYSLTEMATDILSLK